MMFGGSILILTLVQLLLIEGVEPGNPVENKAEIESNLTRRILYGKRAREKDFPYLVRIAYHKSDAKCGGSIIANHWIMTAGHCILGQFCEGIELFPAAWSHPLSISPSRCYVHEKHRPGGFTYDIALLKVSRDILQDGRAQAIKLPPPGKVYPAGTTAMILGWGKTEKNKYPVNLVKATIRLDEWAACNKRYLKDLAPGSRDMPLRTLCSLSGPSVSAICWGDSGGPLVTDDGYAIGVVSFATLAEGPSNDMSAFLNVADYLPWIYGYLNPTLDTRNFPVGPEHASR